jgi:ketosteroid isomerase-like protein
MKIVFSFFAALFLGLGFARADGSDELLGLEKVWNEAHVKGDAAALEKLWDDELTVTVPEMPLFDKKGSLAIWKTGRMKFDRYETSDLKARMVGETGIVTGRVLRSRTFQGNAREDDWRFTKVYVKRNGKWKVLAWHASPSPTRK